MFKVIMVKGRKLKKVGGDLEVYKQNDISSKPIIREQNVTPSKPGVDESNNPCGLKLAMVVICNSNDEILSKTYWEFGLKNGGLDYFRIYIH
jgi:hypothetical protein